MYLEICIYQVNGEEVRLWHDFFHVLISSLYFLKLIILARAPISVIPIFEDAAQFMQSSKLQCGGEDIHIEMVTTESSNQIPGGSRLRMSRCTEELTNTIRVHGFSKSVGPDIIKKFFEGKQSNGGPVRSATYFGDMCVITFKDSRGEMSMNNLVK